MYTHDVHIFSNEVEVIMYINEGKGRGTFRFIIYFKETN